MYLTNKRFLKRVKDLNIPYWNEGKKYRWEYMSYVIRLMQSVGAKNTLEMGTFYIPLNSDSYLLELEEKYLVTGRGKIQDLNKIPYQLPNNHFDCAVALQVWEHLENQAKAFKELCRISKNVILSFPYRWKHGDVMHRGIDEQKISKWTYGRRPSSKNLIKDRIIYFWRNV
jgi:hypothetical protein